MAATFGPDMMMVDVPPTDCFDHGMMDSMDSHGQLSSSPQTSPPSNQPPPNPHFVFPTRPSSSSASSSFSRTTGRRPQSAIEPRIAVLDSNPEIEMPKPRSPALPTFSFNPGASLPSTLAPESAFLSPTFPPSAPSSPRTAAARPVAAGHGHRRGGSEFVGGKIRDGDSITVTNASPTKSESGMAEPMLQPTRPRRGHAHRRSAAISSHDISSIILPLPSHNARGNSAPSSPAFPERATNHEFPPFTQPTEPEPMSLQGPEARTNANDNTPSAPLNDERPAKPTARNRVGFSDTLEFIPRPLSLVSSDASSTATARPGHSVSGSISSLISLSTGERELNSPLGFGSTPKLSESRPSTAGAVLERVLSTQEEEENLALRSPKRRGSIPFLGALPSALPLSPATPSPTRSAKKWTFFSREPFAIGSPTRAQADSPVAGGSHSASPVISRESTEKFPDTLALEPEVNLSNLKPLTKKRSKKQKKVKSWAGTILLRKSKYRYGKQKRRTPTPPPIRFTDELGRLDQNTTCLGLDQKESIVPSLTVTGSSEENDDMASWTYSKPNSLPDEDMTYQMIDLDAALGPFNTPLPRNPEWEAAQRAGGHIKKQLHSAAGMSRFSGPGMHYHHRRAESAPEMVPFEGGRLGFRRFGSSSTMADVFEEDEEEEDGDSVSSSTGYSTPLVETPAAETSKTAALVEEAVPPPPVQELPLPSTSSVSLPLGGAFQYPSWATRSVSERSTPSFKDDAADVVPVVSPGTPGDSASSNRCSGSTTPSPRHIFRPKDLAPVDIGPLNLPPSLLAPTSPFSMTQSSAFPSPRTPMSYDAHRISTAPSSITEDNFHSLLMGEPGPEVRISVDDIPSLTSSNSTMTRESLFVPHPQARNPPLNELPRPASFTSAAFGRRRSSLASLSRLISSSHGERSKLSMEVPMDSEPEKKTKVSKAKRLSRMVQFWKSKEGEAA